MKSDARALGYAAAFLGVALTATYPAMTRPAFVGALSSADLLALRVGVSGLLFAPYLAWRMKSTPASLWLVGIPLSLLQGWGMAALVIGGLQLAPASHSSSLGPGTLSASVALLGYLAFGKKIPTIQAGGILGILLGAWLIVTSSYGGAASELFGDLMFIAASLFGATYVLSVQRYKLPPTLTAAIVCVYSAAVIIPWYLLSGHGDSLIHASASELWIQVMVQGVIRGGICFLALNFSISILGSQRASIVYALLPALGMLSSLGIAKDPAVWTDWAAVFLISGGVLLGLAARWEEAPMESAGLPHDATAPVKV